MIGLLLSPLGRLFGVGAISAVLAALSVGWLTHKVDQAEIEKLKAARASESLVQAYDALRRIGEASKAMNDSAASYGLLREDIDSKFASISEGLKNVQVKVPLPRDCVPDAGRVRSLAAAVDAANAQSSPSGH